VLEAADALAEALGKHSFRGQAIRVEVDKRDIGGGQKTWEWIKKGVPLRVEIGPRDIEKRSVAVCRRDGAPRDKEFIDKEDFLKVVENTLEDIQANLLHRATELRKQNTVKIDSIEEFEKFFTPQNADKPEIHGGFALCHWAGTTEEEEQIQKDHKVTIRCIPFGDEYAEEGTCFYTGRPSSRRVVFAKSY
ncbi:MAG: His/Gly/Thr/Pro-type tRNA ligase C-terminal domain-containing protein, partial [Verrucomicrobiales bacterium]